MADVKALIVVEETLATGKVRKATVTWKPGLTPVPSEDSYVVPGGQHGAEWVVSLANFVKMFNGCEADLVQRVEEALAQAIPQEPKIKSLDSLHRKNDAGHRTVQVTITIG